MESKGCSQLLVNDEGHAGKATLRKCATQSVVTRLLASVVLLSVLGRVKFVLCLGHGVTTVGLLEPGLRSVGSTLLVEFGVVLEDSGLLDVALVVGSLLLFVTVANLLVLSGRKSSWDVGASANLSSLDLCRVGGKPGGEGGVDCVSRKKEVTSILLLFRAPCITTSFMDVPSCRVDRRNSGS